MAIPKIAIACQGGGSHTAFTAGVLSAMFDKDHMNKYDVVGLSGTSGGAICAALTWQCLQKGTPNEIRKDLNNFWNDNATKYTGEDLLNYLNIEIPRLLSNIFHLEIPQSFIEYNSKLYKASTELRDFFFSWSLFFPLPFFPYSRSDFYDFEGLLNKHFKPFQSENDRAKLFIGATEIYTNEYTVFQINNGSELNVRHLLATSAIPRLYKSLKIGDKAYWDGLFSHNPPIHELYALHENMDVNDTFEIWIIQINPLKHDPNKPVYFLSDVLDRRNELIGNISLNHEIKEINNKINGSERKIEIFRIVMPNFEDIVSYPHTYYTTDFDYFSKSDRSKYHIEKLNNLGEQVGKRFMDEEYKSTFRVPHT